MRQVLAGKPGVVPRALVLAGALLGAAASLSHAAEIPDTVLKGITEYLAAGPEAAVKAWLRGSAVEASGEAESQGAVFRQVEAMYGKLKGHHVIMVKELTPSCTLVFLTLDYEKGPVFAGFTAYRAESGWIIAQMNFNTKAEAVLPYCTLCE